MTREEATERAAEIGERLNFLRTELSHDRQGFVAGLARAAEQAVQLVYDALNDPKVNMEHLSDGY